MSVNVSCDYIIIGAGSAGCVLASRLTEDANTRVLLIEAGGAGRNPFISMPGGIGVLNHFGLCDWHYRTEPQPGLADRRVEIPRGKVLGGSSATNALIYCRGHAADYDEWSALGNGGWSYAEVLPYFRRSESYAPRADSVYHGSDGPIRVSRPGLVHPLSRAWVEAGQQAGHPLNDDTSGSSPEGFGPVDMTLADRQRSSTASAYLHPALRRPNLTVVTRASVTRILFDGQRAIGVEYRRGHQSHQRRADREVIVSAGAINSPHVLLLSGVGDPDQLRRHRIPVVIDLKGVGKNLHDHLMVEVLCTSVIPSAAFQRNEPWAAVLSIARYLLTRRGPAGGPWAEAYAFLRARGSSRSSPDFQFHLGLRLPPDADRDRPAAHGFTTIINQLRPASRGSVTLASGDPLAPPRIDPNYLAERDDLTAFCEGIALAREVHAQPALRKLIGTEIGPGPAVTSDAEIAAYIRSTGRTGQHVAGSCRMGADPLAVVDAELRVHGVTALRVVDASIMPRLVSGNTNMPTIMIAEKAADLIQGKTPPITV